MENNKLYKAIIILKPSYKFESHLTLLAKCGEEAILNDILTQILLETRKRMMGFNNWCKNRELIVKKAINNDILFNAYNSAHFCDFDLDFSVIK